MIIKKNWQKIMTEEQGKPLKEALGEMTYANGFLSWFAEEGKRVYGETIPASVSNKRLFVTETACRSCSCHYALELSCSHDYKKSGTSACRRLHSRHKTGKPDSHNSFKNG
ncbi:aldehyde dehydrogenase family protein [Peribacillus frigoritolerans]|nr:aldehyde dehydrogenase family protein [Peribacillus frigoritolerans]